MGNGYSAPSFLRQTSFAISLALLLLSGCSPIEEPEIITGNSNYFAALFRVREFVVGRSIRARNAFAVYEHLGIEDDSCRRMAGRVLRMLNIRRDRHSTVPRDVYVIGQRRNH